MEKLVKDNIAEIVAAVAIVGSAIMGYGHLKSSVVALEKEQVTQADLARMVAAVKDLERLVVHPQEIAAMSTVVQDTLNEIDTLYVKAELALKHSKQVQSQLSHLEGRFEAMTGCGKK